MVEIGRLALLRLVLRLRVRQMLRGFAAGRNPAATTSMLLVGVLGLLAAIAVSIGGLAFMVVVGSSELVRASAGGKDAAVGGVSVLLVFAVVGISSLLMSRRKEHRILERFIAFQPVSSQRVDLVRRLDDAMLAVPALLVLVAPLLLVLVRNPQVPAVTSGDVAVVVSVVTALAWLASQCAAMLRTLPEGRSRMKAWNRAGQLALLGYLLPLAYPLLARQVGVLPRPATLLKPALSALEWARLLPITGQLAEGGARWGSPHPTHAIGPWLVALVFLLLISGLRVTLPAPGDKKGHQVFTGPSTIVRSNLAERWLERRLYGPERGLFLLYVRLTMRDWQVGQFSRLGGPVILLGGVSLWQAIRGHAAASGPIFTDPAAVIVTLVASSAMLVLADLFRREGTQRWIVRLAPIESARVDGVAAVFATLFMLPVLLVIDAFMVLLAPELWPRAVFVLFWAPLLTYLSSRMIAAYRDRGGALWLVRAATMVACSATTAAVCQLSDRLLIGAGKLLLPTLVAAVALAVTVIAVRPSHGQPPMASKPVLSKEGEHL